MDPAKIEKIRDIDPKGVNTLDTGWCQADVVSEERQANARQFFKLFYTDPAEPIESRFQLHHFDKGKQCMSWRPVATSAAPVPRARPTVGITAPAVTRSRTHQLGKILNCRGDRCCG